MSTPVASIIVTAYNYEAYVEECLASCLDQEGDADFEVILVDDGSTDGTLAKARTFAKRISIIAQKNAGVEHAANTALAESSGRFIVRVDADDRLKPNYLHTTLAVFANAPPDVGFVYSEYYEIDANGQVRQRRTLPDFDTEEITRRGDFLATGTLYRRSTILAAKGYPSRKRNCGLENYELTLTLLQAGTRGICVHENLFDYRIHAANMSSTRQHEIVSYGDELAARFKLERYQTNEFHPYHLRV